VATSTGTNGGDDPHEGSEHRDPTQSGWRKL